MNISHGIALLSLLAQLFIYNKAEYREPSQCCYAAYNPQCKATCEQIFRYSEPTRTSGIPARQISRLTSDCAPDQGNFWMCVNKTIPGDQWVGRRCCEFALSSQCRNHCLKARSRDDLRVSCRLSDEVAVMRCVDRQEEGQRCCSSTNAQCTAVCKRIFYQDSAPSASEIDMAEEHCEKAVLACIQSGSSAPGNRNKPADSIMCCNKSDDAHCRVKCQEALQLIVSESDIMDEVSKHCGPPNVALPLWQCFLRTSTNNMRRQDRTQGGGNGWGGSGTNMAVGSIEVTGIDSAKLQCCDKAVTDKCKELCKKTYSKEWTENVGEFHGECMSYNNLEHKLTQCLEDVENQCTLGCSGLNFCTNFNNRPTSLFRSCTSNADEGAKTALQMWRQGAISLPNLISFDIPVKDVAVCQPHKWKAIACALQIRPCHSQGHNNWICKSDCVDILSECLDTSRVPRGVTAGTICDELSPPRDPNKPCISLSTYLVESPYFPQYSEVTQPCSPNPCNGSQICEVRRRKCSARSHRQSSGHHRHQTCPSYVCKPGCPMGELASQLVPQGAYVRIPETGVGTNSGGNDCYKMCMCGSHGLRHNCVHGLGCSPAGRSKQCLKDSGRIYDHGSLFEYGCNLCLCHSTRTSCTSRFCPSSSSSTSSSSSSSSSTSYQRQSPPYTGLPCNCPSDYSPVCAQNGQTYPNFCIAQCVGGFGLTDVEKGACTDIDPCRHSPCTAPEKCVKHPRVCLGSHITPAECPQYDCVQLTACTRRHSGHSKDYICDTRGREHHSICSLLLTGLPIEYWDHCRSGCEEAVQDVRDLSSFGGPGGRAHGGQGTVCAVGGDTFRSECSAWGHGKLVDYLGPCRAVGQLLDFPSLQPRCSNITCRALDHHNHCQATTPPGACCPICAGEIRLLVNEEPLDEIRRSGKRRISLTMAELLGALRLQISMAECDVFGYPSIENDIVVLIAPISQRPTRVQVEACMSETAKLASLLSSRSPLLTTFIPIHVVVMTTVRTSSLGPLPALLSSGAPAILTPHLSLIHQTIISIILIVFCASNPVLIIQSISIILITVLNRLVMSIRRPVDTVHLVNR